MSKTEPNLRGITRPQRYIFRMSVFLVIVTAACAALAPQLMDAFLANAVMNGMILGVLLLGVIYIFRQVLVLRPEIDWMEHLRRETQGGVVFPGTVSGRGAPRLLSPLANMLGENAAEFPYPPSPCAPCSTEFRAGSRNPTRFRAT